MTNGIAATEMAVATTIRSSLPRTTQKRFAPGEPMPFSRPSARSFAPKQQSPGDQIISAACRALSREIVE
jgi:hypothetical protein